MTIVTPRTSRNFITAARLPAVPLRKGSMPQTLTDTLPVETKGRRTPR